MAVPVPVLGDEYLRPMELVDFYVANILDRRKTAAAIKLLSESHPLTNCQHLKRVCSNKGKDAPLQILLRAAVDEGSGSLTSTASRDPTSIEQDHQDADSSSFFSTAAAFHGCTNATGSNPSTVDHSASTSVSNPKGKHDSPSSCQGTSLRATDHQHTKPSGKCSGLNKASGQMESSDSKDPLVHLTQPCSSMAVVTSGKDRTNMPGSIAAGGATLHSLTDCNRVCQVSGGENVGVMNINHSSNLEENGHPLLREACGDANKIPVSQEKSDYHPSDMISVGLILQQEASEKEKRSVHPSDLDTSKCDINVKQEKRSHTHKEDKHCTEHSSELNTGRRDWQRQRQGGVVVELRSVLQCEVPSGMLGQPYRVKVPKRAPLTRAHFEDSLQYWPVTFHEDKRIARLLSGKFFSASEVTLIQGYLQKAEAMAQTAKSKKQGSVGVVVVDPVKDTVVAKGHSLTDDNPLMHAAMVAIDLVARSQGGGFWNLSDKDMCFTPAEETKVAVVLSGTPEDSRSSRGKTGPYLCTGYHVYLTQEPCPMCSMALLHSRVSRVYYSQPLTDGALGSRYRLHTIPSLNHHFDVFHCAHKPRTGRLKTEQQ